MILDTSALSAFLDGDAGVGEVLRRQARAAIPVIVLGELRYGIAPSKRRSSYEAWLESHLFRFEVLPVTEETAVAYAALRVALRLSGRPIPANDAWIAALALQHRLPVLSRDKHFDVVPDLERENWSLGGAMDLFLMQHGEAKAEIEDPERPLTDRGRQDVERVARHAATLGLGIALVQHSGKRRARQTAEIFASHVQPRPRVEERPGLAPNDDPAAAARALEDEPETRLLVGHLPHLAKLASLLLIDDAGHPIIAFRMGALVALRRDADGWRLRFLLTPELVPV